MTVHMSAWKTFGLVAVLLAGLLLPGCVVVAESNSKQIGKAYPGSASLQALEPGKVTRDAVTSLLGEPTRTTQLEADKELLVYEYRQTKRENVAIFLLLTANKKLETTQQVFVMLEDGVVTKVWEQADTTTTKGCE